MMLHREELDSEKIDVKELIGTYLKHWKWFLLSIVICIVLAFIYIRYSVPKFEAVGSIQIVEEKGGGGIDVLKDLNILSADKSNVEDEIQILTSRSNFIEIVKRLGLNTRVLELGNIRNSEIYPNPPFNLNFIAEDSTVNKANIDFYLSLTSDTTFEFSESEDGSGKIYSFGNIVSTAVGDIVITPNAVNFDKFKGKKLKVEIRPPAGVAQSYRKNMSVSLNEDYSNILNLAISDEKRAKAIDIINTLVAIYNQNSINDKKIIADRTSNFIDERITEIAGNLSSVDQSAEDFKSGRGLTDIASQSNINLNVGASNQQELASVETQFNIAASMKDIVDQQDGYQVLPSNIGLSDPTIASTTEKYNQLVLERERLLKSSNELNPVIVNLDQQLQGLKRSMQSSLNSAVNNLGLQVQTLSNQQAIINSRIYSAPKNERALRDITRRQQTTESLYLYLLQKREEAQVAAASTSPRSKVIDSAYSPGQGPVSPRKKVIFMASFILGLLVPFGIIYAADLMDSKIHNMHGVQKMVKDIPVLGELPKLGKKEERLIILEDRSVLAEALRIIRTNLDYLIRTKVSSTSGKNNIIFVTSGVSGEGKTFLSTNLSMILASTQKKVLLVGADIRNPKFYNFFVGQHVDQMSLKKEKNRDVGLTDYILDNNLEVADIVSTMLVHSNTFDVIYSGRIVPNPAELLMSRRIEKLFSEVSADYDYVIVDTAPIMLVTDTLLINDNANHTIYVTRANVTEEKTLEYPIRLQKEGKIKGLSFVINDVKVAELGYGGKYGYGYGRPVKKWWQF
ncbi:MAG: polysaccharide biosynthesis tyrosine autokinase [Bacteroidota bacterium]